MMAARGSGSQRCDDFVRRENGNLKEWFVLKMVLGFRVS
jgi:hypothetical protein